MESFDVVVIGSGPGGYVAAIRAAQLGLKTACVEKGALGGVCLNVGCIPSKALLHFSEFFFKCAHEASSFGVVTKGLTCDFSTMMQRKRLVVSSFREGIGALFKKNRVTLFQAAAHFSSAQTLTLVNEDTTREIQARHVIIATGSESTALPFLPFDEKRILSSTGALALSSIPKRMLVVGAGIIGVELGSVYNRLGSEVTFIEFLDRICPTLDASLSKELYSQLSQQGMHFHLSSKVTAAEISDRSLTLKVSLPDQSTKEMSADCALICIGRRPYTKGLQLENAGITLTAQGTIPIDGQFRTCVPSIFAIGDVVDGPMLAHKAEEEGIACAEIIASYQPTLSYIAIPNVVYTYPEVASVGLTEEQIRHFGIAFKTGTFPFKANSRARAVGEDKGFVRIYAEEKKETLLGVHIIGVHASELIAEPALALRKQLTLEDIIHTPHAHPTFSEAIREAALDAQKRAINK